MKRCSVISIVLLLLTLTMAANGCGSGGNAQQEFALAPESALPDFVRSAPLQVKEAYRFAIANPDVLGAFPCYCGCGQMEHESNLDCYIRELHPDGSVGFETHAFGWTICVDITRDVMRLSREGRDLGEIRAYIDAEYSKYGPPTNTEPVQ